MLKVRKLRTSLITETKHPHAQQNLGCVSIYIYIYTRTLGCAQNACNLEFCSGLKVDQGMVRQPSKTPVTNNSDENSLCLHPKDLFECESRTEGISIHKTRFGCKRHVSCRGQPQSSGVKSSLKIMQIPSSTSLLFDPKRPRCQNRDDLACIPDSRFGCNIII